MSDPEAKFLRESLEILERTPLVLRTLLEGLSDPWVREPSEPDRWNPFDIVGHLIHGEKTDWMPRLRIILDEGESRPFPAFDRGAQFGASASRGLGHLLDAFAELRAGNVEVLRECALDDRQLQRTGRHPELGRVTARQLLATWVAHDLGHIAQATRQMAGRLAEDVGPWADPRYMRHLAERLEEDRSSR